MQYGPSFLRYLKKLITVTPFFVVNDDSWSDFSIRERLQHITHPSRHELKTLSAIVTTRLAYSAKSFQLHNILRFKYPSRGPLIDMAQPPSKLASRSAILPSSSPPKIHPRIMVFHLLVASTQPLQRKS
jgi:hypothetical protein